MNDNRFLNFVAKHISKLKGKFSTQIKKIGFDFDDDVFSDTMVKCNNKHFDENALEEEMENYFWMAFKNNTIRELNYSRNKNKVNSDDVMEELLSIMEESEEDDIHDDYVAISNMIINEFGMDLYKLFSLHANGASYDKLIEESNIKDLKYQFRKIREFVRKNYKK